MEKGIYIDRGRLLIQGDRMLLVLTPKEVIDAIVKDEDTFMKACKRGKHELRTLQNVKRMQKDEERIAEKMRQNEAKMMRNIAE